MGNEVLDGDSNVKVTSVQEEIYALTKASPHIRQVAEKRDMIRFEKGDSADDAWKPLKNVLTDITTNEFLPKDVMFDFISIIVTTFSQVINTYLTNSGIPTTPLPIKFVYKGGNTLRFIAQKIQKQLPGNVAGLLEQEYGRFFKKSDADFSIYIDPRIPNYDKVFDEVTVLAAFTLDYIRTHFSKDSTKFLMISRYNPQYIQKLLRSYLKDLRAEAADIGVTLHHFALGEVSTADSNPGDFRLSSDNPPDYYITDQERTVLSKKNQPKKRRRRPAAGGDAPNKVTDVQIREIKLKYGNAQRLPFYITVNDTLEWPTPTGVTKFNLVRMKVNFNTQVSVYTVEGESPPHQKRISGELIDVSIPHRDMKELKHAFEHSEEVFHSYTVVDDTGKREMEVESYTIQYMIHDLERMLFVERTYPWEDAKYEKRLKRLFFMYLVQVLNTHEPIDTIMKMMEEFKACIGSVQATKKLQGALHVGTSKCTASTLKGSNLNVYTFVTEYYPRLHKAGIGAASMMQRFDATMTQQFELMVSVLKKIQESQSQQDLVEVQEGTVKVSLAGGGLLADLRHSIRAIADRSSTKMAHVELATQVNASVNHPLHQILHGMDEEARLRSTAPGTVPVLWINPFHKDPLRWTEEPMGYEKMPGTSHYMVRILCATSSRHALIAEGVRDMDQRHTMPFFSGKHPF